MLNTVIILKLHYLYVLHLKKIDLLKKHNYKQFSNSIFILKIRILSLM